MNVDGVALRHCSISLFLIIVTLTGCHRPSGNGGVSVFPDSKDAAQWARTSDIRTFTAGDLWKYIDGEAERYRAAGVQTTSTADYRFRDKYDAVVDIYEMAGSASVRKILASEPVAGGDVVAVGDSARLYGQSLIFVKGRYLVRITAYQDAPEMKPALLAIARAIEARLGSNP
jgi:Family of unknown function (DUF6599)